MFIKIYVQMYALQGNYTRVKNRYVSEKGIKLILSNRKNTDSTKPDKFILFQVGDSNQRNYFSSLFRKTETEYRADYNGIQYEVSISDGSITIKRES